MSAMVDRPVEWTAHDTEPHGLAAPLPACAAGQSIRLRWPNPPRVDAPAIAALRYLARWPRVIFRQHDDPSGTT